MGVKKYVFDFFCSFVRTLGVHVSYMMDISEIQDGYPELPCLKGHTLITFNNPHCLYPC